ncbi:DUF1835 domain-containing protein [Clostridium sp. YIM B02500]|uniref:DUF1835 domain-containing protein n=1 Tax=Clostridium sp. YIM B02500 TaxID=2910681 RepID=UPI001EEE1E35|nr:DUF1835 domain-containing protein [Clostridium sp. YIM B02500]
MESIIHICFSQSAGGSLKHAVKKKKLFEGKKVIVFPDDISIGIIQNGINLSERLKWVDSINKEDERIRLEEIDYLKRAYKQFYKEISNIKDIDVIYLWYGECCSDICGMMYALELLKNKIESIYFINVSEKIYEGNSIIYTYRAVAEIITEKLKEFIKIRRKIEYKEYHDLINQWESLKDNNSILRIFKDGKVQAVSEDYFDINILKYTENEFRKCARIVGSVMGYSEEKISDDYIFWRIGELTKSGMLEYKGKFGIMREMEVKITQKGIEYMSTDSEAISFWRSKETEKQFERDKINEAKNQGRMEERIRIAKKLMDILDAEVIAEKTGLTVMQIKNLIN